MINKNNILFKNNFGWNSNNITSNLTYYFISKINLQEKNAPVLQGRKN